MATIEFFGKGGLSYVGEPDAEFVSWLESCLKNGITRFVDLPDEATHSLTITEQGVSSDDPGFPLALKEFLTSSGYEIIEKHPEIEEEIKQFLAVFPDDNKDKKDILQRLPKMSHLEQTTILKGLQALNNTSN